MSAAVELTLESFSEMLDNVGETEVDEGAYGRLVYDSLWRIVLVVDQSDVKHFKEGVTYSALFSENNSTDMPLTLERIESSGGYDVALLIFNCDRQPENFKFPGIFMPKIQHYSQKGMIQWQKNQGAAAVLSTA